MKRTVSYSIALTNEYRSLRQTIDYYRQCVRSLIDIVLLEEEQITKLGKLKSQSYIEHCIHTTACNQAKYASFDRQYYKFPSYLRRSAITEAIGIVKSYRVLVQQWQDNGEKGKRPRLNRNQAVMPCFFKKNMFSMTGQSTCKIKLYINHDWVWRSFTMKKQDIKSIEKMFLLNTGSAPVIEKRSKKYALRFTFQEDVRLSEDVKRICAVDLGINNDAVCCVMEQDGTVLARYFIRHAREKDRMFHILNQKKKAQRGGAKKTPKLWRFIDNYNTAISRKTAADIVFFANLHHCDAIVMEYLDTKGKKHGPQKEKLTLWRKREIQKLVESRAHHLGMRYSRVCARNTSRLAYDGSGPVKRHKDNYSLCTFASGKEYHCDLNASYNIGARYFVRKLLKPLSESSRLAMEAKVPSCAKRTQSTLSTLTSLYAAI